MRRSTVDGQGITFALGEGPPLRVEANRLVWGDRACGVERVREVSLSLVGGVPTIGLDVEGAEVLQIPAPARSPLDLCLIVRYLRAWAAMSRLPAGLDPVNHDLQYREVASCLLGRTAHLLIDGGAARRSAPVFGACAAAAVGCFGVPWGAFGGVVGVVAALALALLVGAGTWAVLWRRLGAQGWLEIGPEVIRFQPTSLVFAEVQPGEVTMPREGAQLTVGTFSAVLSSGDVVLRLAVEDVHGLKLAEILELAAIED